MAILFDDSLKTGIEKIDEQHERLFRLASKFEKIKRSKNMFLEALVEVENYVSEHFLTEEGYMKNLNYPFYEEHKKAHEKFKINYKRFALKAAKYTNVSEIATELTVFVEDWIKEHYTQEDVRMALFLKENLKEG